MPKLRACALIIALGLSGHALATTTPTNVPNSLRDRAGSTAARDLLVRVDEALNALTYTHYVFSGEYFDAAGGVYKVDCSGYLNRVLEDAAPSAFDELAHEQATSRPEAADYYDFIVSTPYDYTLNGWRRIRRVKDLRPGDVLVYRYDTSGAGSSTGHAMVVVDVPSPSAAFANAYRIRVSDSARSGHSTDNRGSSGSGVGAGYVLLAVDPATGKPARFAWSLSGYWKSGLRLAMARPMTPD